MTGRSGWSDERRVRQRQAIQRWRPWEKSTGPRTHEGKGRSSQNAKRQNELLEAEAYLRLLRLGRERDAGALGGRPTSPQRLRAIKDEIDAIEESLDPNSGLAKFLAKSEEADGDWLI